MTKRFLLMVCLGALAAFTAVAQAATKHPDSDAIAMRVLQSNSSGAVFTGTAKDKILGAGLVIVKATPTSANSATDNFVATAYFKTGTLTVKGTVTTTTRADGSGFDYKGSAKVTGGTGKVKGAKGSLKIVGSATAADPTYQTYKLTGSLTY
jgi:hypothetical protein